LKLTQLSDLTTKTKQDFYIVVASTQTCTVCQHTKGMLTRMTKDTSIEYDEIDIEEVPAFRGEHLVFTVPTVLIFSQGKEIYRSSRYIEFGQIDKLIHRFLD
jgi:Glutaredoxin.